MVFDNSEKVQVGDFLLVDFVSMIIRKVFITALFKMTDKKNIIILLNDH